MRLQSSCQLGTVPCRAGGSASKTVHPLPTGLSVVLRTVSCHMGLPIGCLVSLVHGHWLLPQREPEHERLTRAEAKVISDLGLKVTNHHFFHIVPVSRTRFTQGRGDYTTARILGGRATVGRFGGSDHRLAYFLHSMHLNLRSSYLFTC